MSSTETPEAIRADLISKMGSELGSAFYLLRNELWWLYYKWGEYVELFGSKPSRIDLLNRAAPFFFRIAGDSLWDDVLLHLCRMTDPPKSAGKTNLTVCIFPGLVSREIRTDIQAQVEETVRLTDFCRDWRNRRLAHRDLGLALNATAQPLKAASRKMVKDAIQALAKLFNAIDGHYRGAESLYDSASSIHGARSLIYILDDGIRVSEERKERFRTRQLLPIDLERPDL